MASKQVADLTWQYLPVLVNSHHATLDFVEKLLPIVRPQWKKEDVIPKVVNNGLGTTNDIIGFCLDNNSITKDIVLLRINGKGTEQFINREREVYIRCLLSQAQLAPPVHCEFMNGLCYGYVPGQTLKPEELKNVGTLCKIAKSVALVHSYTLPSNYLDEPVSPITFIDSLYSLMLDDNKQPPRFKQVYGSKKNLQNEIFDMKKVISTFVSPVVLCHNDLQCGNIIVDTDRDTISFIDYEYAGPNHSACDIGNFFCEFAGLDPLDYDLYPDEIEQKRFITLYLKERSNLKGQIVKVI